MTSLYIHIPFCERKCFYCSFAVAVAQTHKVNMYLQCLEKEAKAFKSININSVYIGGGTPSFLTEEQCIKLFKFIQRHFNIDKNSECTFEVNPEGLNLSKLKTLKVFGVNRISLGIQSFQNNYLKYLGRIHDAQSAQKAFGLLRKAGFDNISVDLMHGFKGQAMNDLSNDLTGVVALKPEHCSVYTLTIEENSRFFVRQETGLDNQDQKDQYELIVSSLKRAGLDQYEVSNFARPGKESVHNRNYWAGGNYIGLGVGAHSHLDGRRSWNVSKFPEYLDRHAKGQTPQESGETLEASQRLMETILFGLRTREGVQVSRIEEHLKCALSDSKKEMIERFIRDGFLTREHDSLKTTSRGRLVLDSLCAELI